MPSLAALLVLALAAGPLGAQPYVPDRRPLVMDAAGVISAENEQYLTSALIGFRQTEQREVSVITAPNLQGYGIDDYARALRAASGLDDSRNDDGAVLLVAPNDMVVRIEAGSAVKSILTDAVARDIVETWVVPSFQRGDMDKGVLDGAGTILGYLELPPEQAAALAEQARLEDAELRESEGFPWDALVGLLVILILWSLWRRIGGVLGFTVGAISLIGRAGSGGFGGFGGGGRGFNGGGATGRW